MGNHHEQGPFSVLLAGNFEQDKQVLDIVLPEIQFLKNFSKTFDHTLNLCAQEEFDLVFVEFGLPELEMADKIAKIRENHLNPGIPIIAVVDSEVKSVSARARCHCDEAIVTPMDTKRLGQKVWRCLERAKGVGDEISRRLLSFVEGDPVYYNEIEAFIKHLPEQIDDIHAVFDCQLLHDLSARICANMQGQAKVESPDGESCLLQIDEIFKALDQMAQACLTAQFKTDCSRSDDSP